MCATRCERFLYVFVQPSCVQAKARSSIKSEPDEDTVAGSVVLVVVVVIGAGQRGMEGAKTGKVVE